VKWERDSRGVAPALIVITVASLALLVITVLVDVWTGATRMAQPVA